MKKYKKIQGENNQLEKQVSTENKESYQKLILYLRGANINIYQQEVIRQDLLQLVLEGQTRGERIEEVLGDDLKGLVDESVASVPQMTNIEKLLNAISLFLTVTIVLGLVKASTSLMAWFLDDKGQAIVEIGLLDLVLNVFVGMISVFIIYNIVDNAFKEAAGSTKQSKVALFIMASFISVVIVSIVFLSLTFNPILLAPSLQAFTVSLSVLAVVWYLLEKYIVKTYHH